MCGAPAPLPGATFTLLLLATLLAGCATTQRPDDTPMRAGGPDWAAVDKSVERVKERERNKPRLVVESERTAEAGYFAMTEDEYATALDTARAEIKKANPKMSDRDVETEASKRADEARRKHENTYQQRVGVSYEFKRPDAAK